VARLGRNPLCWDQPPVPAVAGAAPWNQCRWGGWLPDAPLANFGTPQANLSVPDERVMRWKSVLGRRCLRLDASV
jgi:hypothetical protein